MSSKSARQSAIEAITTYKPEAAPLNFVDTKPTDIFGCNVFNDRVMRERLPKSVYKALRKTIEFGERMGARSKAMSSGLRHNNAGKKTAQNLVSKRCALRAALRQHMCQAHPLNISGRSTG